MPIRKRAVGGVCSEVRLQPLFLRRTRGTRDRRTGAVRVQRDDVPGTDVVRVIPLTRITRRCAEIVEVGSGLPGCVAIVCARRLVFVVPRDRVRDRVEPTPTGIVRPRECVRAAALVGEVSERQNRRDFAAEEEVGRVLLAAGRRGSKSAVEIGIERGARNVPAAAITGSFAPGSTTAVGSELAAAEPALFVAVTRTRIVEPTSAATRA